MTIYDNNCDLINKWNGFVQGKKVITLSLASLD